MQGVWLCGCARVWKWHCPLPDRLAGTHVFQQGFFIYFSLFFPKGSPSPKKSYPIRCHPVSSVTFHKTKYEQALSSPNPVSLPLARPCLAPGAGQTFCLHVAPHGVCLSTRTRSPWAAKTLPPASFPSLPPRTQLTNRCKRNILGCPCPSLPLPPCPVGLEGRMAMAQALLKLLLPWPASLLPSRPNHCYFLWAPAPDSSPLSSPPRKVTFG